MFLNLILFILLIRPVQLGTDAIDSFVQNDKKNNIEVIYNDSFFKEINVSDIDLIPSGRSVSESVLEIAYTGDVYQGSISDSILNYLIGFVQPTKDYFIYRSGQYEYKLIICDQIINTNNVLSGNDAEIYTFTQTGSGYNDVYYNLSVSEESFVVNISNSAYVYGNVDGLSEIISYKEVEYAFLFQIFIISIFLYNAIRDLFRSVY